MHVILAGAFEFLRASKSRGRPSEALGQFSQTSKGMLNHGMRPVFMRGLGHCFSFFVSLGSDHGTVTLATC